MSDTSAKPAPRKQKTAQALADLSAFVMSKQAQKATGVAGADVKVEATDGKKVDKNSVQPEKDQPFKEQKHNPDPVNPVKSAAETLGQEILSDLQKEAQKATGVAGADVKVEATDGKKVDKNSVQPEKDQPFKEQKHNPDPVNPVKAAELEAAAAKIASFELGRKLASVLLGTAPAPTVKKASAEDLVKEAARKDFEALIAKAAAELESREQAAAVKQAEAEGEFYADWQLKTAALDEAIELADKIAAENEALRSKLAAYEAFEAEIVEQAQAEKQASDRQALIADIVSALKGTPASHA